MGADEYYAMKRGQRTFTAKFTSTCVLCEFLIKPGDECRWDDDKVFVHAECPDVPDDAPTTEVCARCFLAIAVSGACGCEPT